MAEPTLDPLAGLDFTRRTTTADGFDPTVTRLQQEQSFITRAQTPPVEPTFWQLTADIASETLTGQLIREGMIPSYDPDPSFSTDEHLKMIQDARSRGLPEDFIDSLYSARSKREFFALEEKLKTHAESQGRLAEAGWGWQVANFVANMVDPASLAVGLGVGGLAAKGAAAMGAGRWITGATGAVAGNVAIEGVREGIAEVPVSTDQYMLAFGSALLFHSILSPLGNNPNVAPERQALEIAAKNIMAQAMKPPAGRNAAESAAMAASRDGVNPSSASIAAYYANQYGPDGRVPPATTPAMGAAQAADVRPVNFEGAGIPDPQAAVRAIQTMDPAAISQAVDEIVSNPALAAAQAADQTAPRPVAEVVTKVAETPEEPLPREVRNTIDALGPPETRVGTPEPRRAQVQITDEKLLNNPRWVGDYSGADGVRYRIMSDEPNGVGPYRVMRVGPNGKLTLVARGIDDLQAAVSLVPDQAVSTSVFALADRLELGSPPRLRKDRAREIAGDGLSLRAQNFADGRHYFIMGPDDRPMGYVTLGKRQNGWEVEGVEVYPEFRGQNLQQKAYDLIEKDLGQEMRPSGTLTPKGYRQWLTRDPEAVKFHQPSPFTGDMFLSPKYIFKNREFARSLLAKARGSNWAAEAEKGFKTWDEAWARVPDEAKSGPIWDMMFKTGEVSLIKPEARQAVDNTLDLMLPSYVRRQVLDELSEPATGSPINGMFHEMAVWVALNSDNPVNVARHEAVHALRGLKVISDDDWTLLQGFSRRVDARKLYDIDARYGDDYRSRFGKQADDKLDEEAIAHMVADYLGGRRFEPVTDGIIDKIVRFIMKLREMLAGEKIRTANDALDDIGSGRLARAAEQRALEGRKITNIEDIPETGRHPGRVRAYHATSVDFERFAIDTGEGNFTPNDIGLHFGTGKQARSVLGSVTQVREDSAMNLGMDWRPRTYPVVLDLKNPLHVSDHYGSFSTGSVSTTLKELLDLAKLRQANFTVKDVDELAPRIRLLEMRDQRTEAMTLIREFLESKGYDGLRYRNMVDGEGWSYVTWKKGTVSSATADEPLYSLPKGDEPIAPYADWDSIRRDQVPEARFSWLKIPFTDKKIPFRFDNFAKFDRKENVVTATVGRAMLNNSTGEKNHLVNTRPADLEKEMLVQKLLGQYNRMRIPAYMEYAKHKGWNALDRAKPENANMFLEEVGLYVGKRADVGYDGQEFHPSVVRLGGQVRKVLDEVGQLAKDPFFGTGMAPGRALPGSEAIGKIEDYLWRKIKHEAWSSAIRTHGEEPLIELTFKAIKAAQKDGITDDDARILAKGYVRSIDRMSRGYSDDYSLMINQGDYERLSSILKNDADITDEQAKSIMERLRGKWKAQQAKAEGDKGNDPNLKSRVLLAEDVDHTFMVGDKEVTIKFRDLLDNNIENILGTYIPRMSGRIALARMRIENPARPGTLLVDGINSDAEFDRVIQMAREWNARHNPFDAKQAINKDEADLRWLYDRLMNRIDPVQFENTAVYLRRMRDYNGFRLLGQLGFAQLGESGTPMGALGARAFFSRFPAIKRAVLENGELSYRDEVFRVLDGWGIGTERLHGFRWDNSASPAEVPFGESPRTFGEKLDAGLRTARRVNSELSGMAFIQQQQELATAAAFLDNVANMALRVKAGGTLTKGEMSRFAQMGLKPDEVDLILQNFRHAKMKTGVLLNQKLASLNMQQWDQRAAYLMEYATQRYVRKLIQQRDLGSMAMFMKEPIWQTVFHLRDFGLTAWANQTLYNIHMGDPKALMTFVWGMGMAAAVRAAQVQLVAGSRSDGDEYREKYLAMDQLGLAAFSRTGFASIIPMGIDTLLMFGGQPGLFNARSSGQASDILFGNPTMSFFDQASRGIGGMVDSVISDRDISQAEVRAVQGLFTNLLPISLGTSYLIQDLPERAPRKEMF